MALLDESEQTKAMRDHANRIIVSSEYSEEDKAQARQWLRNHDPSMLESAGRQFVQGASLQWADNAGITSEESNNRDFYANPTTSTLANLGGELLTGATIGRVMPGLSKALGGGVKGTAIGSGLLGAMEATVAGAGALDENRPLSERVADSFLNYGLLGGAFGTGGALGGEAVKFIMPYLRGQSVKEAGARQVGQAMREANLTPQDVARRVREMGPGAMPADVDYSMQRLNQAMLAGPGDAQDEMAKRLISRSENTFDEVAPQVRNIFDVPDEAVNNPTLWNKTLKENMESAAQPFYDEVHALPANFDSIPENIKKSRFWKQANDAAAEMRGISDVDHGPNSMQHLDYVKRALDGMIETAPSDKAMMIRNNIIKKLIDTGDKQTDGAYAQARNIWAGAQAHDKAFKLGRNLPLTNTDPASQAYEEALAKMDDMSQAELEALRVGFFGNALGAMGEAEPGGMRQIKWRTRGNKQSEFIDKLLGSERADALQSIMDARRQMQITKNMATAGSKTAPVQAYQAQLDADNEMLGRLALETTRGGAVSGKVLDNLATWKSSILRRGRNAETTRLLMQVDQIEDALQSAYQADRKWRNKGRLSGEAVQSYGLTEGGRQAAMEERERNVEEAKKRGQLSGGN